MLLSAGHRLSLVTSPRVCRLLRYIVLFHFLDSAMILSLPLPRFHALVLYVHHHRFSRCRWARSLGLQVKATST